MALVQIKSFGGITPRISPRLLDNSMAQTAVNCTVYAGTLIPLKGLASAVATLTKTGTPATIYRFGQDTVSDADYWFHWTTDVDVVRSQINGDTSEWTFYTDGTLPKATYSALALSGSDYPTVSRPLGLPAPTDALTTTVIATTAKAILYASEIVSIEVGEKVGISLDGTTYTDVTVATATAAAIAAQLTALTDIDAAVVDGNIEITRTGASPSTAFKVRYQVGTTADTAGAFTYDANLNKSDSGGSNTSAFVIITDNEIGSVSSGNVITITTTAGVQKTLTATGVFTTAASYAAALTSAGVIATAYGSCVVLTPGTQGGSSTDFIEYKRMDGATQAALQTENGSETAQAAFLFITATDMTYLSGNFAAVTVNAATELKLPVPANSTLTALYELAAYGVTITLYGSAEPFAVLSTSLVGSFAFLGLRAGDYPVKITYTELLSSSGTAVKETRVYTYTVVNKESGYEFESAPCTSPSTEVTVLPSQQVTLTGFSAVVAGYTMSHRRIYRSTSGTFLVVAEIPVATATYTDNVLAEDLGEEIPTLTWLQPPATLKGLINMPNGYMAGFTGRDVYLSDPYHPHAWPVQYMQSVDFPVVGLGRMDTTIAVLTKGTPYFLQGSRPDSMVLVKTDVEQACASKRSIVSTNNSVIYASPDGLVMLSPSGSKVLTEQKFTRAQWQSLFLPTSIKAYQHDMKYVAFYDTGAVQGGFVYDLTTGEFSTNDLFATAGYTDLARDNLYLAFADRSVKIWLSGTAKTVTWKSKKFTLPKVTSFACAQLDAEAYDMTVKFYADNTLIHTETVTNRLPFRLPSVAAKDWEIQIEGSNEVFGFAMAQSTEELSSV